MVRNIPIIFPFPMQFPNLLGFSQAQLRKLLKPERKKQSQIRVLVPCPGVSLHCHEFGVFYAAARLKKLGVPVNTVATLHATLPGRTAGYNSIQKRRNNDSIMAPWSAGKPGCP